MRARYYPDLSLFWFLILSGFLAGCGTPMTATRLRPPVVSREGGVSIAVPEVGLSAFLRKWDFSQNSRVLVVMDLESDAPRTIDLRNLRLRIEDPLRKEAARGPVATGVGEPPRILKDGEFAAVIDLKPGKRERVWAAFGGFTERSAPNIAERVVLELPLSEHPGEIRTLTLSDPGKVPLWQGEPIATSGAIGYWLQLSADEGSFNLALFEQRYVVGPLILGYGLGIGFRFSEWPSENGQKIVFGNFSLQGRIAWPVLIGRLGSLSPYLGFDTAILLSDEDVNRPNWFGPSVGVELSMSPLVPRSGPFPVNYPRSPLGAFNLNLGLVHWFGPDRKPPSFGMLIGLSFASEH